MLKDRDFLENRQSESHTPRTDVSSPYPRLPVLGKNLPLSARNLHFFYLSFFFNRGEFTFLVAVNKNCSNVCVLNLYDTLKVKNAMLKCMHYVTEFNIHNSVPLT
jgi:hypothetical protein